MFESFSIMMTVMAKAWVSWKP